MLSRKNELPVAIVNVHANLIVPYDYNVPLSLPQLECKITIITLRSTGNCSYNCNSSDHRLHWSDIFNL